jgi:hypothetical protein
MKHLFSIITAVGFTAIFFSCKKQQDDWKPNIVPNSLSVTITLPTDSAFVGLPLSNFPVIVKSERSLRVDTLYTDSKGNVQFTNMDNGNYIITSYRKFSEAEMLNYTNVARIVAFNGTIGSFQLGSGGGAATLPLSAGSFGSLVFKQLYYVGSGTQGASLRDQFVEIYNNTADTIYADSLYFGTADGINTLYNSLNPATTPYILATTRQYDWTKSLYNVGVPAPPANANTDYLFANNLFRVPGNGKTYPIAPGKSIIIAASAQNHKAPFVGANGTSITVANPDLTVDLSQADFEVYLKGLIPVPSPTDIDNPAPNMIMYKVTGTDLTLNLMRNGFFIFKTKENVAGWNAYTEPNATKITASSLLFWQVPKKYIIDAVETQYTTSSVISSADLVPAKLGATLDAGFGYCTGTNNSQALMRKTDSITVDGRHILKETNNSSNDFELRPRAVPRGF